MISFNIYHNTQKINNIISILHRRKLRLCSWNQQADPCRTRLHAFYIKWNNNFTQHHRKKNDQGNLLAILKSLKCICVLPEGNLYAVTGYNFIVFFKISGLKYTCVLSQIQIIKSTFKLAVPLL